MQGIKCVLLDIEGTICPISFVKETLFPYALRALPDVLATKWDDEVFKAYRDAFPAEARESSEQLQAHVEDLTKRDVKVARLKNLQGYLWESGYKAGAYSTPLFPDVAPQLEQWKKDGVQLAIYSSGSVFAQKLLFGHVQVDNPTTGQKRKRPADDEQNPTAELPVKKRVDAEVPNVKKPVPAETVSAKNGESKVVDNADAESPEVDTRDLQDLISDWFDTTNTGLKTEPGSYEKIAKVLKWSPREILFLSDNVKEVDAAEAAGMQTLVVDRPGNAPLTETDKERFSVVNSLDETILGPNKKKAQGQTGSRSTPRRRVQTRAKTKAESETR